MRRSILVLSLLLATRIVHAQSADAGTTEFVFLRTFVSARSAGLASSGAVNEGSLSALGFNPAGLARLDRAQAEASLRTHILGTRSGMAAIALPWKALNLAGQFAYQTQGSITGLDENGMETGKTHQPTAFAASISVAETLGPRLAWGATVRLVEQSLDIDNSHAYGIAADLGTILQPGSRRFTYALAVQNLGTKISAHTQGERQYGDMPLTVNAAVRMVMPGIPQGQAILDIQKPLDNTLQIRLGYEHNLIREFTLRGALRTDALEVSDVFSEYVLRHENAGSAAGQALRGSVGATLRHGTWSLDYAYQFWSQLDGAHLLTINYAFGSRRSS